MQITTEPGKLLGLRNTSTEYTVIDIGSAEDSTPPSTSSCISLFFRGVPYDVLGHIIDRQEKAVYGQETFSVSPNLRDETT